MRYHQSTDICHIILLQLTRMCCSDALDLYEAWHSSSYRQKAIDEIYDHICADDTVSHGISIGPVCESFSLTFNSLHAFSSAATINRFIYFLPDEASPGGLAQPRGSHRLPESCKGTILVKNF